MEQLILHLIGDYVLQTDWMAKNKVQRMPVATLHAFFYSLPFLLLSPSLLAIFVIFSTHAIIDGYRLARFVVFAKNKITEPGLKWADSSETGYHKDTPIWLAFWLMLIVDSVMHMAINYAALRWL